MEAFKTETDSKIHRLLNKRFSGNVNKMFDVLQGHLKKEAIKSDSFAFKTAEQRGVSLRAFIKGMRLLKERNEKQTSLSDSENLYNFRGSRGYDSLQAHPERENKTPRLPLPSYKTLHRHLSGLGLLEIKTIKSNHLRILKLDLTGIYSRTEIAKIVGVSDPTVTNVLNSPAIREFKNRAQAGMEDEYSSLLAPSIAAIRDSLKDGVDLTLRQDTAFKFLKTQGKGVGFNPSINIHEHRHSHDVEVTGKDGGPIQVSELKQRLLKKVGLDPKDIVEGEFRDVEKETTGD